MANLEEITREKVEIPESWTGSKPEYLVYQALIKLGYDFTYQASVMGGRMEYGGAVLDFVIPSMNIAINVMSVHWHYSDPRARRRDAMVKAMVEGMGLTLIYIDEEDALSNALYFVQEAIRGIDHSRGG